MASPRKDQYQLSIEFITDESKAFAKLIEDTKQYEQDIRKSQAAIKGYQKELQATNLDEQKRIELLGKIALEEKKVADNLEKIAASGKETEKIDLDKLVKPQLIQRARQLQRAMDQIPASHPQYKQLEAELKRTNDQLATIRQRTRGVAEAMEDANNKTGIWGRALNLLKNPVALIGGFAAAGAAAGAAAQEVARIVEETNELRREISQLTGETGEALDTITVQVKAIAKTFDQEEREVLLAANTLAKEFGITYEESLAQISEGFLNGADASREFLDNIREYSVQFQAAGFSAEEFIGISIRAQQEGIFSDKGLDVVKEFGLRIREQTTAVKDAMEGAFGKEFSEEIFGGINDGSITTAEALKRVAGEMKNTEIPANQLQTVIADVFAAPGEDAGRRFIEILGETGDGFFDASGEANIYIEAQRELLAANTGLAEAETELAKRLRDTGDVFSVLWTNMKTVGINVLNDVLQKIEEFPAKLRALAAAIKQPFTNLFGSPEDARTATQAYYETLIGELEKNEVKKQVAREAAANEENAALEKLEEQQRIRRQQAADRATDREVQALERRREKLLEVVKKYKTEEEIAELDAEEQKIRRLEDRFQESIDEAIALETAGVENATQIRLELEAQKIKAVSDLRTQLLHEDFEKAQAEADALMQEEILRDLERDEAKREAQRVLKEELDQLTLSERELALQDLEQHHQELLALAFQYGLDVTELEAAFNAERARINEEFDKEELDKRAEAQAARAKLLQDSFTALSEVISGAISLIGSEGKKAAAFSKLLTLAQIAIDTAKAISSLTAASEANPANAITFGGAGVIQFATGLARILANIASAKKALSSAKFAGGGHTGRAVFPADETGERPVGVVHENEWVAPRWMTRHPEYRQKIDWLETVRVRGFADGGFTSVDTTPRTDFLQQTSQVGNQAPNQLADLSETNELLRMLLVQGDRPKPAIVKREDLLDADEEDAFTAKYAGF